MNFEQYRQFDAITLAEMVAKKEVSAVEVAQAAIQGIEIWEPHINALTYRYFDQAISQLKKKQPDGVLAGVPFLIKDLGNAVKGWPLTSSCRAMKNNISDYDSALVKRYRQTGMTFLGRTNTPEFGLYGVTEPLIHGATHNPWDVSRNAGGSSGGSAAAVAAGLVPVAQGGDGGGSIRIPSAYNGVFGLKPSRGRIPTGPDAAEHWGGAASDHVISRTVRDSALLLDLSHGVDVGAPYGAPAPDISFLEMTQSAPKPMKIALQLHSPLGGEVDSECVAATQRIANMLEDMGHVVEEAAPEYDGFELAMSFLTVYFADASAQVQSLKTSLGRATRKTDVEPQTWSMAQLGKAYRADEVLSVKRLWNHYARLMGEFHRRYDLLLTPMTATLPAHNGANALSNVENVAVSIVNQFNLGKILRKSGMPETIAERHLSKVPFTQLANVTGQPAMSVPAGFSQSGLPIGVQFVAPYGDEGLLLQLAAQLEMVLGWPHRFPEMPNKALRKVG